MPSSREMQFDRHMSDNEALMWNLEKDPALSSWFASISIMDGVPSFDRLRARLEHAVAVIPRLRQRVTPSVGRLSPPMWIDDVRFDLDFHIRRVALPAPGDDKELHELAVKLLLDPFERTRPLWQFFIIEGLSGGRGALFQKIHHTITDGEGGVRMAEHFVDLTDDAPDPDPMPMPVPVPPPANFGEAASEALNHNVRRIGGVAARVIRSVASNPVGSAKGVAAVIGEVTRALAPSNASGEQVGSPIWRPRTMKRWYGTISLDLDDVKRTGKAMGGTVNDVFVAGALAGAARYHADRDVVVDRYRVAMPVSTRSGGGAGGNQFALTTTDLRSAVDAVDAFGVVHEELASAKSGGSVDVLGSLSMIVNLLPTQVLTGFALDQAASVDFTVSNVRGAPIELYMAGTKMLHGYPMGPISGCGFNLSTVSYHGSLDMGMVVDSGAIEAPGDLHRCLSDAYADLIAAGR